MGRPSTYSDVIATEICNRIADGEPLRVICRDEHMPPWRTVYEWRSSIPDFAKRLESARDLGFDAIAEDTLVIIDESPERTLTQHGDKVDAGYVQWQRNRVEQRMKLLAKWSPKYRENSKVEFSGNLNVGEMSEEEIRAELAALAVTGALPAHSEPDLGGEGDAYDDLV